MNEVVFKTEVEAEAQQALDYQAHIAANANPSYVSTTKRWAIPRQRLDGKWAYPCCPVADYAGLTVEEYSPDNYPKSKMDV